MRRDAQVALALLIAAPGLGAQSVSVAAGNIFYHPANGGQRRITGDGLDSMPALSPDGRWVAFVRRAGDSVNTALGMVGGTELWLVRVDGSNARRLLRGRGETSPEKTLANFDDPVFSLDGRTVYFGSRGWVTSDALHAIDMGSGRERYLVPANTFELLVRGRYRGDLMVGQHRYRESGSYDGMWIVSPRGQVIRLVALDDMPDAGERIAAARLGKLR